MAVPKKRPETPLPRERVVAVHYGDVRGFVYICATPFTDVKQRSQVRDIVYSAWAGSPWSGLTMAYVQAKVPLFAGAFAYALAAVEKRHGDAHRHVMTFMV